MIGYEDIRNCSDQELIDMAAKFYHHGGYANCEVVLSYILDNDPTNKIALTILGSMYTQQDRYGMAENIFKLAIGIHGATKTLLMGLGSSIRNPERADECFKYLDAVLEMDPEKTLALTNKASMLNEICRYKEAKELAEKSLEIKGMNDAESPAAIDAISFACLGMEDFGKGFDLNKQSLGIKFRKEVIYGDEGPWEGEKDKIVIVYGEQGIGDEIFYGSVIPDAIRDSKHIIIDCDKRLEGLFKRSFPEATVYGTRNMAGNWLDNHQWDARCAMADLSRFYRREKKDFPGTPFLKPDPVRVDQWKHTFKGRTKIGIGFRGGNKYTNRRQRTVPLETFRPLTEFGDLVSLEYADFDYGDFPIEKYDFATMSEDYDDTAALVAGLDYVVTTCTSVVHLAGAMGIPCYVLRNKHYTWRYAHDMPWYNSVHVIHCDGDWDKGMEEVIKLIQLREVA